MLEVEIAGQFVATLYVVFTVTAYDISFQRLGIGNRHQHCRECSFALERGRPPEIRAGFLVLPHGGVCQKFTGHDARLAARLEQHEIFFFVRIPGCFRQPKLFFDP